MKVVMMRQKSLENSIEKSEKKNTINVCHKNSLDCYHHHHLQSSVGRWPFD